MNKTPAPTVLITGCAGYIGSNLAGLLLRRGWQVRGLDCLLHGGEALLGLLPHENFTFLHGDVADPESCARALEGADAVVHLAAIVGEPACNADPDLTRRVNREGSRLVMETAQRAGVKRFLFVSTCSNYGISDPACLADETSPVNPISLYAETKVEAEQRLLSLQSDTFHPTVCRLATVYGLSARMRFDLTVNEFCRDALIHSALEVYGEQFWRPYVHVHDVARALAQILATPPEQVVGEVFNVGDTRENYQKQTLAEMLQQRLRELKVTYVRRDQDPRDYRVCFDKIRDRLNFSVQSRVGDGMDRILRALRQGFFPDPFADHFRN